jgi:hypothetical protein
LCSNVEKKFRHNQNLNLFKIFKSFWTHFCAIQILSKILPLDWSKKLLCWNDLKINLKKIIISKTQIMKFFNKANLATHWLFWTWKVGMSMLRMKNYQGRHQFSLTVENWIKIQKHLLITGCNIQFHRYFDFNWP